MKLNLSKKHLIFALLYSAIFPVVSQYDMYAKLYEGIPDHTPILSLYASIITFPFLPIATIGGGFLSTRILGSFSYMPITMYLFILLQVILTIHFLNWRKARKSANGKNKNKSDIDVDK